MPVCDKETSIFVTLALSCDVYNATSFTISGLTGTQTVDNPQLNITVVDSNHQERTGFLDVFGKWTQSTGTLEFTVSTESQDTYSAGHWEANTPIVMLFHLHQSATEVLTDAIEPTITGSRTFAPWQFAGGETKAAWWAAEQAPIPLVNLTKPDNTSVLNIINGNHPLVCRVPALVTYNVTQSNPFIGVSNTITLSFSTNMDFEAADVVKVRLGGLTNNGLNAVPSFDTHNWKEITGFTSNELGDPTLTNATLDGDSLIWTVADGQQLTKENVYVLHFNITNPLVEQEPNVFIQIYSESILSNIARTPTPYIFNFTTEYAYPNMPLMGVTNGLNAMKIVEPFVVRHFDDSIDTPLAPNVITMNITTRIAFVAGDQITVSGVLLGHTTTAATLTLADVANSATTYWGTTATYNGVTGEIVFTVTATMDENTGYVFTLSGITNPTSK